MGSNSPRRSGHEKDSAFPIRQFQATSHVRTKTGTDLGNWSFASGRASGSNRDDAGNRFDKGNTTTDITGQMVKRLDDRVRSVSLRFRGECEDNPTADQTTKCGHQQNKPPKLWQHGGAGNAFSSRLRWNIPDDVPKDIALKKLNKPEEAGCAEAGHDPDKHAEEDQPSRSFQIEYFS